MLFCKILKRVGAIGDLPVFVYFIFRFRRPKDFFACTVQGCSCKKHICKKICLLNAVKMLEYAVIHLNVCVKGTMETLALKRAERAF
jgi:hypothetical protein